MYPETNRHASTNNGTIDPHTSRTIVRGYGPVRSGIWGGVRRISRISRIPGIQTSPLPIECRGDGVWIVARSGVRRRRGVSIARYDPRRDVRVVGATDVAHTAIAIDKVETY